MKNFNVAAIFFLLCALLVSCGKNAENKDLSKDLPEITRKYVQSELKIEHIDSVRIVQVDTINKFKYAGAALNFLTDSKTNLTQECQQLQAAGDTVALKDKRLTLSKVEKACVFYEECQQKLMENDPKVLFYFVSAYYYYNGLENGVMFFLKPDGEIHTIDPMDTSVLE